MTLTSLFLCRNVQPLGFLKFVALGGLLWLLPLNTGAAIPVGCRVTFSATAEGTPTPTFQWKRNGTVIAGANGPTFVIPAVSVADAGTYRVTASNIAGSADSADEVLVVEGVPGPLVIAPIFTLQPVATLNVNAGETAMLTVAASGTPTPTYQWHRNGVAMAGATAATLTLVGVTATDSAVYTVVATNGGGSVTSNSAALSVTLPEGPNPPPLNTNVAPSILSQPTPNQTVVAGGTASFVVVASGTPAPAYQWRKNGVAIGGATAAALTVAGVTSSEGGTYTVVVTNAVGSVASSPAVLTVSSSVPAPPPSPTQNVAPSITSQPTPSQAVAAGGTVTLSVVATGIPAPNYQWKKNEIAVPGATNATLVLTGVAPSDSGSYLVAISNSVGLANSSPSVVTVSAPEVTPPPPVAPPPPSGTTAPVAPVITSQPVAIQNVLAGADVTFRVEASGSPAPAFQWKKNGISIAGATNATLVLRSTTTTDAATYSVSATNSAGSASSTNSVLSVGVHPSFLVQPASQAIRLGARVMFSVVAVGMPTPTLSWQKDGVALPGATGATLILNATTASDLATYSVMATNPLGTATSADASLVVAAPPIITLQPTSQTVAANSNVTFSVSATGGPTPTYQWKKNGSDIPGATCSTLTLVGVGESDEGAYTVEAINSVGWVPSHRVMLTVNAGGETPPGTAATPPDIAPTASRIVNLSVRSRAGSGDNSLIVGFVVGGQASKPMLLRGVGPALGDFGVIDALIDPTLSLYTGAAMSASNDDWSMDANASQIVGTCARLGAFRLPESSADSALMANLQAGAYTVQVNGKASATGVALVEVYDAAATNPASLVNLSVRTHVGTGADAPNVGFVVSGTAAKRVLIRAIGPTLAAFGVAEVLSDPQLELFKGGERLDGNDNWGGDAALSATFSRVGAFGLADAGSQDAVLLVTLEPGAYTVVASGVNGTTGIALVEVYDVN